jgi:hypothetical protein
MAMGQENETTRTPQDQNNERQWTQPGQQNQERGNDADADGQPQPDSTNGGSTGDGSSSHYGQGLSGGVDVGAIEPGRTGSGGEVDR